MYTYLGHSSFLIEINGAKIIFDPFISPNPLASGIALNDLRCDYVFVSHGHFDHVADVETIARNSNAIIVANYEIATYFGEKNLRYHPMNIGGQWDFGQFKVKAVNAVHSSVLPDGTYGGSPIGFIVSGGGKSFYYSGDTALTLDMQLIANFQSVDRAFLCLGDNFTMGPEDALIAAQFIKCDTITGMHFDTFPYIKISHDDVIAQFEKAGKSLTLPEINQTYTL